VSETAKQKGKHEETTLTVDITAPKRMSLYSIEVSGDLVILRGTQQIFGEVTNFTYVYKRLK